MSARRRLAPSTRSSARAAPRARRRRFERGARIAVGFGERVLGLRSRSAAARALGFSRLHFADQTLGASRRKAAARRRARRARAWLPQCVLERRDLVARAGHVARSSRRGRGQLVEPAVGHFGLARERLLLGAHFGEPGALAVDVVAHAGKLAFQIGGRRQRGERAFGLGLGGSGLVAARRQAGARLGQRGKPRGLTVEHRARARGVSVSVTAGGLESGLRGGKRLRACRRPRRARSPIRRRSRQGGCAGRAAARRRSAHEPRRQSRPSATDRRRATPAAGRACSVAAKRSPSARSTTPICLEPARKLRRRLDVARQRLDALGQRRVGGIGRHPIQCIGAAGSTGASRSSPSAAPSAFS